MTEKKEDKSKKIEKVSLMDFKVYNNISDMEYAGFKAYLNVTDKQMGDFEIFPKKEIIKALDKYRKMPAFV